MLMQQTTIFVLAIFGLGISVADDSATVEVISYEISDRGDGSKNPPDYGLRLDGLFDSPSDSLVTNWTFSFDQPGSGATMEIDPATAQVRIYGTVIGGRDTGTGWDPATVATWQIDFLFDSGVTIMDQSTGFWSVESSAKNYGTMKLLDAVDLDGTAGSDQGRFIALANYLGGTLAIGGKVDRSPFVDLGLKRTDGFIDSTSDPAAAEYVPYVPGSVDGCCTKFEFRAEAVP